LITPGVGTAFGNTLLKER